MPAETTVEMKDQLMEALNAHTKELSTAIAKADEQIKNVGQVTNDTKGEIEVLSKKTSETEARLAELEQITVDRKSGPAKIETYGEQFINSPAFKEFAEKGWHKGMSKPVEVKDITTVAASAGPAIWSQRDPEIVSEAYRPLSIRSLIPTVPTASPLVEWVKELLRTNNAGPVAEGALKPKSDITYERQETAVRKIAHFFKTSMEAMQDFPRLQGEINNNGFNMLAEVEEDQLLLGDGTGQNLNGLIPQATDYATAATKAGDTVVDVLRRAILQVTNSYYSASGVVLNPADWADIELMKDGENRYLFSAATTGAQPRLWGLPVVQSFAMPAGQYMVGAFAQAATIYDRMQRAMMISTENEDDFVHNMITILFEERIALAVKRPAAFIHGKTDGTAFA